MDYSKYKLFESMFSRTSEPLTVKYCTYEAANRGLLIHERSVDRYLHYIEEHGAIECINPDGKPRQYKWINNDSTMTEEEALLIYPYIKHGGNNMPKKAFGRSSIKKAEQALQILEDIKMKNPHGKVAKWLTNDELIDDCVELPQAALARAFNNALFDNVELVITHNSDSGEVSEVVEPDAMVYLNGEFRLKINPVNGFKISTIKLDDVLQIDMVTHDHPPSCPSPQLQRAA